MSNTASSIQCPTCHGTGKIVVGYGAVCTEPIAKVKKCPTCGGKGNVAS